MTTKIRLEKEMVLTASQVEILQKALSWCDGDHPDCRFGEDETHTETAVFENGYEMDIKVSGVQYDCPGGSNSAWSEAVLFKDGCEVACTDPGDDLLGEWELEHDGCVFVVNVVCDGTHEDDDSVFDAKAQRILWDILKEHAGHAVEISVHGGMDDPVNITLDDVDTGEVILDAGLCTLCAREDV